MVFRIAIVNYWLYLVPKSLGLVIPFLTKVNDNDIPADLLCTIIKVKRKWISENRSF